MNKPIQRRGLAKLLRDLHSEGKLQGKFTELDASGFTPNWGRRQVAASLNNMALRGELERTGYRNNYTYRFVEEEEAEDDTRTTEEIVHDLIELFDEARPALLKLVEISKLVKDLDV